jgi:polyisoprenyl-phosphate glycosyltransferase
MNVQRNLKLSIVIPIHNEESAIEKCLRQVSSAVSQVRLPYEIIVVDDGSTDRSWKVLQNVSGEAVFVKVLHALRFSRNFGKEAAIAAGLEVSQGDGVIVMDSDLQHPPHLIPEMVRLWLETDVDVVEGVKEKRGRESYVRRLGAKLFYGVFSRLTGFPMRDQTDFKLIDRRVVNAWLGMRERNLFFRGMTAWLGFKHAQVPFVVPDRTDDKSKWSPLSLMRLSLNAVSAFSSLPLQVVTFMGFLFLLFALVLAADALFMKLTGRALDGFTTVILLLLIVGSFLMISLGIIGMYLSRIYEETKQRPRYIRDEIIEPSIQKHNSRYGTPSNQIRPERRNSSERVVHAR